MSVDEIIKLYESGKSTIELSELDGRSRAQIYRVLKGNTEVKDSRITKDHVVDEMVVLYVQGYSSRQVASRFGMRDSSVRRLLKNRGVLRTPIEASGTPKHVRDAVVALYLSGVSAEKAGKEFGVSQSVVYNELKRRSIPTRTYSEANARSVTNKRKRGVRGTIKVWGEEITFDSFYELCFIIGVTEKSPLTVIKRCNLIIPYLHNGKPRHFNPDFELQSDFGTRVVEVKPNYKKNEEETLLKMSALEGMGIQASLVTESDLTLPNKEIFGKYHIRFFKGEVLDDYLRKYKKVFGNV